MRNNAYVDVISVGSTVTAFGDDTSDLDLAMVYVTSVPDKAQRVILRHVEQLLLRSSELLSDRFMRTIQTTSSITIYFIRRF